MDLSPYSNRAEHAGTDVAIFGWEGQQVWADTRRDIDSYARQLLGAFGFVRADAPEAASSYRLRPTLPGAVLRAHATTGRTGPVRGRVHGHLRPGIVDRPGPALRRRRPPGHGRQQAGPEHRRPAQPGR